MASSSKKEEFLDRDEVLDEGYEELTEDWLSEREMDEPPQDLLAAVRRIIQLLEIDFSAAKQYLEEYVGQTVSPRLFVTLSQSGSQMQMRSRSV